MGQTLLAEEAPPASTREPVLFAHVTINIGTFSVTNCSNLSHGQRSNKGHVQVFNELRTDSNTTVGTVTGALGVGNPDSLRKSNENIGGNSIWCGKASVEDLG